MNRSFIRASVAVVIAATTLPTAAPVQAQTISLVGTIVNLCVLTVSTPGILAVSGTGTELSTTQSGAVPATLTVVATGTNPTVTFTAPGITGPSSGGATTEFAYTSSGGANRTYGTTGYIYAMNRLLDTITINGRATNASGFASGLYTLSATATCAQ